MKARLQELIHDVQSGNDNHAAAIKKEKADVAYRPRLFGVVLIQVGSLRPAPRNYPQPDFAALAEQEFCWSQSAAESFIAARDLAIGMAIEQIGARLARGFRSPI